MTIISWFRSYTDGTAKFDESQVFGKGTNVHVFTVKLFADGVVVMSKNNWRPSLNGRRFCNVHWRKWRGGAAIGVFVAVILACHCIRLSLGFMGGSQGCSH
eukprot:1769109-Ditylum_brightwellii.AAC.1